MTTLFTRTWVLLICATLVEAWLCFAGLYGVGNPMGDLSLAYEPWVARVLDGHLLLGISTPWVYPVLALVPIFLAKFVGFGILVPGWLVLQYLTLLTVLLLLVNFGKPSGVERAQRFGAGYFWLACLLLLGPVSISRIDFFSVSIVVIAGLAISSSKQNLATILVTLAAWIKVWPVAVFSAIWVAATSRRTIVLRAAAVCVAIILPAFLLGANTSLFGFVGDQLSRGIQIESPWASPWLVANSLGDVYSAISYNRGLQTFEVAGPKVELFAQLLGLVQLGALLITVGLGYLAIRRSSAAKEVLVWVAFTATLDLIFFNKVGSPQFITWLSAVSVIGLLLAARNFWPALGLVLSISALTGLVYPLIYDAILAGSLLETLILQLRNLLLLVALVYANLRLSALTKRV